MAAAFGTNVFRGDDGPREIVAAAEEGFESYRVVHEETRITSEGALLTRGHIDVQSRALCGHAGFWGVVPLESSRLDGPDPIHGAVWSVVGRVDDCSLAAPSFSVAFTVASTISRVAYLTLAAVCSACVPEKRPSVFAFTAATPT